MNLTEDEIIEIYGKDVYIVCVTHSYHMSLNRLVLLVDVIFLNVKRS